METIRESDLEARCAFSMHKIAQEELDDAKQNFESRSQRAAALEAASSFITIQEISNILETNTVLSRKLKAAQKTGQLAPVIHWSLSMASAKAKMSADNMHEALKKAQQSYDVNIMMAVGHYYQNQENYVDMAIVEATQAGVAIQLSGEVFLKN
jgi:hypothetical protein